MKLEPDEYLIAGVVFLVIIMAIFFMTWLGQQTYVAGV